MITYRKDGKIEIDLDRVTPKDIDIVNYKICIGGERIEEKCREIARIVWKDLQRAGGK
jgi:hypothetical protein